MFHIKNNKSGQSIIEAVVALSAIMVVLSAISIATLTSVTNSQFIKSQSLASKYAQQGLENIRYTRNNDPIAFAGYGNNTYCVGTSGEPDAVPAGSQCTTTTTFSGIGFIREAKFQRQSPYCSGGTQVTITVRWSSGRCEVAGTTIQRYCHNTQIVSCFADPTTSGSSL